MHTIQCFVKDTHKDYDNAVEFRGKNAVNIRLLVFFEDWSYEMSIKRTETEIRKHWSI